MVYSKKIGNILTFDSHIELFYHISFKLIKRPNNKPNLSFVVQLLIEIWHFYKEISETFIKKNNVLSLRKFIPLIIKARKLFLVVNCKAFDIESEEGRANEIFWVLILTCMD